MTTPVSEPASGRQPRRRTARTAPSRPPTRRDSRRPADAALRAAAHRARERRPPFWFAHRLLLVLSGQCPVHTLLAYARGPAYDRLAALAPLAPLRPRGADRAAPAVLEARGTQPRDGVIEAFARISTGAHQRAMAFRLEWCPDGRWRCTAVELDVSP
ncbi:MULTISPECIES: Rv3235 family protein [unclassified Streptomyces]|uniref:Rv3235 family protein n=1 Tax=unclassified Streptomyces TaxID=2593676 RepID=UPI001FFC7379|nr:MULTISPECIES: Rv3235 family protein [unclassified Streptomyces]